MKRQKLLLTAFLIFAMALTAIAYAQVTAPVAAFTEEEIYTNEQGEGSKYLGGLHTEMGITCIECHGGTAYVDDSESAINSACIECHGGYEELAKLTESDINPHNSHLGVINCTACHASHTSSYMYCNHCHDFSELEISFAGARPEFPKYNPADYNQILPSAVEMTDVVVIGSGGAGMTAAITAHDAGANVIIIEKMPIPGGNTQLSAGGMNAAFTRYQKAAGIKDSPESMYDDTMKGGKNMSTPELANVLAFKSNESIEWLRKNNIFLSNPGMGGGAANARFHAPEGGGAVGAYLVKNLKSLVAERNIDMRVNSEAVKLLTNVDGDVIGVLVKGKHSGYYEISAKSVVMAAGGFSANADMVTSYQPSYAGMTTSNQPGAVGGGMVLGEVADGKLIGMEQIQIHPTVAVGSQILITEAVRGRGAIVVDHSGNRIMDELTTRDKASAAILAQQGKKTAYLIFDDKTREALKQIDGYFHLHLVKQGTNAAELAKAIDVPAANLEKTLARYNEFVTKGKDTDFGRANMPQTMGTGNLYAIEIAPGVHYTMGGLQINTDAQVVNKDGKPIKNFYAAGEVTGGVHGANRLGGNSISETITFGRIAGENAYKNTRK